MYLAAVREGKTRIEENATPRILSAWLEHGVERLWIDLLDPSAEELAFLQGIFELHPLAVEECDHSGVRPKIEEFERQLYLVLHGINHNEGEDRLNTVEFKVFLWKDHLITVHDKPSTSVRATQEQLTRNPQLLARGGVDNVLHQIIDAVIDHYFPLLEAIETLVEKLEGEIFRDPTHELLEEMLRLRRKAFTLHRLVQPQMDILGALASGRFPDIEAADVPYFRDVYDHLGRINDRINGVREMLTGTMECYLSQSSNRMNAVMKSLAVLATVILPASFVSSLLGMNLEYLPGRQSPSAFWLIAATSMGLSLTILLLLRRMKWL
jgi:magnesium transporter